MYRLWVSPTWGVDVGRTFMDGLAFGISSGMIHKIVLFFDGDDAGLIGAQRLGIRLRIKYGVPVRSIFVPGQDPSSATPEQLRHVINGE